MSIQLKFNRLKMHSIELKCTLNNNVGDHDVIINDGNNDVIMSNKTLKTAAEGVKKEPLLLKKRKQNQKLN